MKNSKENGVLNYIRVLLSVSIVLSLFNPVLIASAGSVIDVSVSSDKVNPDDMAIVVISLSNSENITGMNMTLVYDQSIVSLNNVTVNETVMNNHSVTYNGTGNGKISIMLNGLDSITSAVTPVIDVSMLALVSGSSDIELQDVEFLSSESASPAVSVSNGQVRINSTPQLAEIGNQTVNVSETLSLTIIATDADGDSLTYSTNASFGNLTSNVFSWTPEVEDEGEKTVSFIVSDGYSEDSENVTIMIRPSFNHRPVFDQIDDISTTAGSPVNFTISATDQDYDSLTYYNTSVLPEGSAFYPGNQSFVWIPSSSGVYYVDFGVSDGRGGTDLLSVKITVIEEVSTNSAPVFTPIGDISATESELLEITLNATDVDADPLTYSSDAVFGNIAGNVFSWTPESSDIGIHYINFSVNDGDLWDYSTAKITVYEYIPVTYTPANPVSFVSTTGNFWVQHDWEAGIGNVSDGYNVSYGGTWYNTSNSEFNDTTGLNAHEWSNITVYAYNATSSTLSSGIESNVQIPNNPPELEETGSKAVFEGQELAFTLNGTDSDDDPLTYSMSGNPGGATLDPSTGDFSWTPGYDDNGIHFIDFMVSDNSNANDTESVMITVNNFNNPPVLYLIGSKTVNESEVLTFTLNASDADNETLIYSANGLPASATLDTSTGNFSWTPGYDDSGVHYIEFIVTDAVGSNDYENVTITVNNVNRAPNLESIGAKSINEGQELSFTLVGTDDDINDILSYSMTGLPSEAILNVSTGEFSWTPDFDVTSTSNDIEVIFTVHDGYDSSSQYVIITVNNTNRAPQFPEFATVNASENTELVLNISAVDLDGDSLNYFNNVSFGTINGTDFVWTPDYNQSGIHYVEFTATDGSLSNTTVVTIDVEDVNRAPVIDDDSVESFYILDVGELVSFNIVASDADGNLITYNVTGLSDSANNSLNPVTGAFSWTPESVDGDKVFNGVFTVSDGNLTDSVTATFAVDVLNTPPTLEEIDPKQINETENLVIQLNGTSDDGDDITYNATDLPIGSTFDKANGTFEWTPTYEQSGIYSVTFSVTDGVFTDTEKATITVLNINRAPFFGQMPDYTVNESEELNIVLNGTDPDNSATLTYIDNVSYGSINGGIFIWTPGYTANQTSNGTYHINFTVSDGQLNNSTVVTVYVNDVNAPPVLSSIGSQSVKEEDELIINLTASDVDGDALTYSAQNIPTNASLDSSTGLFSWTPIEGEAGTYSIIFYANDSVDNDYETVTVTVSETTTSSSTTSSSSGGGGGGGGSLSTGEKFENILLKDYVLKSVVKDTETVFSFYKENNSIVSVSFTSKLNGGQVKAVVEMLHETSSQVNSDAKGIVYENMNIYVDTKLSSDSIGNSKINFKVEKEWIDENEIDISTIVLCRYSGDAWNQLETTLKGEDEQYYYFMSTTPGFSPFAISSMDPMFESEEQAFAEEVIEESQNAESMMSTEDATSMELTTEVPQESSSSVVPLIVLLSMVVLTVVGVIGYRNRDYYDRLRMQLGNPDGKRYRRTKK